jgi:hypothetical protein
MSVTEQALDPATLRAEWLAAVSRLLAEISSWAAEQEWQVETGEQTLQEKALGEYATECLTIHAPAGDLVVEPVARCVPGAEGRVDLYAYPSHHRVRLLRQGDRWVVRTDSGIDWPHPWSRATFLELAHALMSAP